ETEADALRRFGGSTVVGRRDLKGGARGFELDFQFKEFLPFASVGSARFFELFDQGFHPCEASRDEFRFWGGHAVGNAMLLPSKPSDRHDRIFSRSSDTTLSA